MDYYQIVGFDSGTSVPCARPPGSVDLANSLVMLDFDGTLVDIADTPDGVTVPRDVQTTLQGLYDATGGGTAIVSGRRLSDLERFLPDFPGILIGTHGAERRADGDIWRHDFSGSEIIRQLRQMVRAWAGDDESIIVEEKPASVVLHFRRSPDRMQPGAQFMGMLAEQTPGYALYHGKMAVELHPNDISKKHAANWLMERYPGRVPIAIGDDKTDEGMIEIAEAHGGFGVKVGERSSAASYCVGGSAAVREVLRDWIGRSE